MIKLIVGTKGTGKTKTLIDMARKAAEESKGNVVCVEKGDKLAHELPNAVRLVNSEEYDIRGFANLYGFLAWFPGRQLRHHPSCLSTAPSRSARVGDVRRITKALQR